MAELFDISESNALSSLTPTIPQSLTRCLTRRVKSLICRDEGAIAVEFSLMLPMLALALVFVGFLATKYQRSIAIEQILHAGAEAAVKDPGPGEVMARLQAAAAIKGFQIHTGSGIPYDKLWLNVGRSCSCPDNWEWATSTCGQMCTGERPQVVKYQLNATYRSSFDYRFWEILNNFGVATHSNEIRSQKLVLSR